MRASSILSVQVADFRFWVLTDLSMTSLNGRSFCDIGANFAVMHNATFLCVGNATFPEELERLRHRQIVCVSPNQ